MHQQVSAIITTHNRIDLLKKAIAGVKSQTYPHIECIVVDDNSSDGTQSYCEGLPDITYIRIPAEESRGGNYARNLGIGKAEGEFIALCDDDDVWLPTKIEKQVAFLQAHPEFGLVYCGIKRHVITKKGEYWFDDAPRRINQGDLSRSILHTTPCVTSSIMFRKNTLIEAGYFDEELQLWQDYELMVRIAQQTLFGQIPECLIEYLQNINDKKRLTNTSFEKWNKCIQYIYAKHHKFYASQTFMEKCMTKLQYYTDAKRRVENCHILIKAKTSSIYWILRLWVIPYKLYLRLR